MPSLMSRLVAPATLAMVSPAAAAEASSEDHRQIVGAVNEIALAADLHEWDTVRRQFADIVIADSSSLTGVASAEVRADELVDGWKAFLPRFTSTQHLIGNHRVQIVSDRARVTSSFIATHRLDGAPGGELWTLGGRYTHTLQRTADGWKVTAMVMTWTWQSGNTALPRLAAATAQTP